MYGVYVYRWINVCAQGILYQFYDSLAVTHVFDTIDLLHFGSKSLISSTWRKEEKLEISF